MGQFNCIEVLPDRNVTLQMKADFKSFLEFLFDMGVLTVTIITNFLKCLIFFNFN